MEILDFLADPKVRRIMVSTAYLFHTSAFFTIIYHGFKYKTYGMPPFSTAAALGFAVIVGFIGPFSDQSHLFPHEGDANFKVLVNLWRFWSVICLIILLQYLAWAKNHPSIWSDLQKFHLPKFINGYVLFILLMLILGLGDWWFIVFYQDYYVNEISPLVMLFVAIGYLATLFFRPKLLGLSLYVAWAWLIGNILLYAGTSLGPMDDPYPNAKHGYNFIYWLYALTVFLNFAYVYLLTKRRHELHHSFHALTPANAPLAQAAEDLSEEIEKSSK